MKDIQYRFGVNTAHSDQGAKELGVNGSSVLQRAAFTLLCDPYSTNRINKSCLLTGKAPDVTVRGRMINAGADSPGGRGPCRGC